jgi:hypothetical protein
MPCRTPGRSSWGRVNRTPGHVRAPWRRHAPFDWLPGMTIGEHLELERLRHKEQRLRLTIRELRVRARSRSADGSVPEGLRRALRDFERDLRAVRSRLRAIDAA